MSVNMELQSVVKDWGGFEEFIRDLHATGDVSAERGVTLVGASGASREIDVLLRHNEGPDQSLTLIECKCWTRKVKRADIDVLHSSMLDLNASKGVVFTRIGYQSGAKIYAKSKGIELFVVRDLSDKEWGLPGKVIDFYLHVISKTIVKVDVKNTKVAYQVGTEQKEQTALLLVFGCKSKKHLIVSFHKDKHRTLEDYLEAACDHAIDEFQKKAFIINGGEECTRYFLVDVNMQFPDSELQVVNGTTVLYVPRIELAVGIKVSQSRFVLDRSEKYLFVLAIEDCVNNQVYAACKREGSPEAQWVRIKSDTLSHQDEVLVNGSVLRIIMKGFFDPKELEGRSIRTRQR